MVRIQGLANLKYKKILRKVSPSSLNIAKNDRRDLAKFGKRKRETNDTRLNMKNIVLINNTMVGLVLVKNTSLVTCNKVVANTPCMELGNTSNIGVQELSIVKV